MDAPLSIWRLSDGRRGHDNQTLGLAEALARRLPVTRCDVGLRGGLQGAIHALARAPSPAAPRLVLGAGHATHAALLIHARRHRARSVVLMSPSLPHSLFDLCIVPEHDGVAEGGNVLLSLGALNRVLPGTDRDPSLGLILVGGPSRHHGWDAEGLQRQVSAIVARDPAQRWLAAGSPRTPPDTLALLDELAPITSVSFADCAPDWLAQKLARAARVWVTADSVSMAFEAASSGAAVGVLEVPARRDGRVQAALRSLVRGGHATTFEEWIAGQSLAAAAQPLQEAARCAEALLERWPDLA